MKKLTLLLALTVCVLFFAGCKQKPVLHVYTWSDYISPEVVADFEKEFGCQVQLDIYDSNEMMFAKLQAGGSGYDVIVPSHYFIKKMAAEGMIVPLDKSKLPNMVHLDDIVLKKLDPAVLEYGVPYFMSYTGIGYNRQKLPDFEPTWNVFKRTDLKGYMTLLDDYSEVIGAGMLTLGYKTADLLDPVKGDERLNEVLRLLLEWRGNVIKFENEQYKNGLAAGEFQVVMGYSMDIGQIVGEDPEKLAFVMPREGCLMSCDMMVISAKAPHPELACSFINYLHRPEVAARNITDVLASCPNKDAFALLPEEVRSNSSLFIAPEIIANSEFMVELSPEQEQRYLKIWNKVKAGDGK